MCVTPPSALSHDSGPSLLLHVCIHGMCRYSVEACRSHGTRLLRLLPDGIDPFHLLLTARSLDEVMRVRLSDDFKQVPLNVALHTCRGGERARGISTNPLGAFHTLFLTQRLFLTLKCCEVTGVGGSDSPEGTPLSSSEDTRQPRREKPPAGLMSS